jgi:hypothetical protein
VVFVYFSLALLWRIISPEVRSMWNLTKKALFKPKPQVLPAPALVPKAEATEAAPVVSPEMSALMMAPLTDVERWCHIRLGYVIRGGQTCRNGVATPATKQEVSDIRALLFAYYHRQSGTARKQALARAFDEPRIERMAS